MTPKVLYQFEKLAGKPFLPSNGTEGMIFCEAFCDNCMHQHPDPKNKKQCMILLKSLIGDSPEQWVFNDQGWPVCTGWKKWDWGDGRDGWDEPPAPPYTPQDPGQLTIFTIDDLIEENNSTVKEILTVQK